MEVTWLPTGLNMLVDFPHCCPVVQNLVTDVLVDCVLKGLLSLHLTLWLLRDVCCADKVSVPHPVRQCQGKLKCL